jgi:hypothetical protein
MSIDCPVFLYTISVFLCLILRAVLTMVCVKDCGHGLSASMALGTFLSEVFTHEAKEKCFQQKIKEVCTADIV